MKKFLLCLLSIIIISSPAYAAKFETIAESDEFTVLLNIESISKRSDYGREYVVAWTKWIPKKDKSEELSKEYKSKIDYEMVFFAFDQKFRQIQELSFSVYDLTGKIVANQSRQFYTAQYTEIIPDTLGEDMYDAVMYFYKKKK